MPFEKLSRSTKYRAVVLAAQSGRGGAYYSAKTHQISVSAIQKARRNLKTYGDIEKPKKKPGPKPKICPMLRLVCPSFVLITVKEILMMVFTVPLASLDEYVAHIYERFEVKLTRGELSEFFKKNYISHKKVF
jgi:hypothetical protein